MNYSRTSSGPNLFLYLDLNDFLIDFFKALQSENQESSVRSWATYLGFAKPDPLINILKKKTKVTLGVADLFVRGLHLNASEASYFQALILYSHLSTEQERQIFEEILKHSRPKQDHVIRTHDDSVFSSWVDGAILELAKIKELTITEEEVSRRLRQKVSPALLRDRIRKLEETGLLGLQKPISTEADRPMPNVRHYYEEVSALAMQSANLPLEEREFQCFAMGIQKKSLPLIKAHLRAFRDQLSDLSGGPDAEEVFQFNLQCFPVTHDAAGKEEAV